MSVENDADSYGFAFDRRLRPLLSLLGFTPGSCRLLIGSSELEVRFGLWTVRTPLDNVAGAEVTGPYSVWKAVGVRISAADRGLTFGTGTGKGLCLRFHRPVRGSEPTGRLRHPGLTLTLADPEAAARRLREAAAAR